MADHESASAIVENVDQDEILWTHRAITVSWVSIALTLISGIIGIVCAVLYSSMAMLGYGLESFVDVFSSFCVVWRFEKSLDSSLPQEMHDEIGHRLEKQSGVGISFSFVAIAIVVGAQAVTHLAHTKHPEASSVLQAMAWISVVAFFILGGIKWHIADKLSSTTMKKDAICSIAVAIISLAVAVSATAYAETTAVWWIDATVATIVSVFLLIYGSRTLFCHGHKWWTGDFWYIDTESTKVGAFAGKVDKEQNPTAVVEASQIDVEVDPGEAIEAAE